MRLLKWLSVTDRFYKIYLDKQLAPFGLNNSQYMFLIKICRSVPHRSQTTPDPWGTTYKMTYYCYRWSPDHLISGVGTSDPKHRAVQNRQLRHYSGSRSEHDP